MHCGRQDRGQTVGKKGTENMPQRTHGRSRTPIYNVWKNVNSRCYNKANHRYPRYGGRGIKVCERWRRGNPSGFENFLEDMGERPSKNHSIDRIDNDGDYTPENCRWATPREQSNNRRTSVHSTYKGRTQTLTQWAREQGLNSRSCLAKIRYGQPIETVLGLEP